MGRFLRLIVFVFVTPSSVGAERDAYYGIAIVIVMTSARLMPSEWQFCPRTDSLPVPTNINIIAVKKKQKKLRRQCRCMSAGFTQNRLPFC